MRLFIGAAFLVRLSMGAALPPGGVATGELYQLDKKSWQLKSWWFK